LGTDELRARLHRDGALLEPREPLEVAR
jgi:hypothetical protein